MNPIEEYYADKKIYKEVKKQCDNLRDIVEIDYEGSKVKICSKIERSPFDKIMEKGIERVSSIIAIYIESHRDQINAHIVKKLKEKMERSKAEVSKDFKLIEGKQ